MLGFLNRQSGGVAALHQPRDGTPIRWARFASDSQIARIITQTRDSIVRITTRSGLSVHVGTGFFVAPGLVATAWHVVRTGGSVNITTAQGRRSGARIKRARTDLDLAVLSFDPNKFTHPVLQLEETVVPGEFALCVGHAEGRRQLVVSDGEFLRAVPTVREDWDSDQVTAEFTYHDYDCAVRGGNSGGPVLNAYGKALSVAVESLELREPGDYWMQAIPVRYLLDLLAEPEDEIRGYRPPQSAA